MSRKCENCDSDAVETERDYDYETEEESSKLIAVCKDCGEWWDVP